MTRDPYQADEAAAFTLTMQSGRNLADTTLDMFPVSGDELPALLARCAPRTGHNATGSATSDFLSLDMPAYQPTPENATNDRLTSREDASDE